MRMKKWNGDGTEMYWEGILSSILMWISAICGGVALVFMQWLSEFVVVLLIFVSIIGLMMSLFLLTIDY